MKMKTGSRVSAKGIRLFCSGQIVATPGALEALEEANQNAQDYLSRHLKGDWGDLCEDDQKANQEALQQGLRLLSSYTTGNRKLWIITEADRSVTTLLLPEEY